MRRKQHKGKLKKNKTEKILMTLSPWIILYLNVALGDTTPKFPFVA